MEKVICLELEKKIGEFKKRYLHAKTGESNEEAVDVRDSFNDWVTYELGIHNPSFLDYISDLIFNEKSQFEGNVIELHRNNVVLIARTLLKEIKEHKEMFADKEGGSGE